MYKSNCLAVLYLCKYLFFMFGIIFFTKKKHVSIPFGFQDIPHDLISVLQNLLCFFHFPARGLCGGVGTWATDDLDTFDWILVHWSMCEKQLLPMQWQAIIIKWSECPRDQMLVCFYWASRSETEANTSLSYNCFMVLLAFIPLANVLQ